MPLYIVTLIVAFVYCHTYCCFYILSQLLFPHVVYCHTCCCLCMSRLTYRCLFTSSHLLLLFVYCHTYCYYAHIFTIIVNFCISSHFTGAMRPVVVDRLHSLSVFYLHSLLYNNRSLLFHKTTSEISRLAN